MELKESKTYENLAKAFAGESQAHIRYKFVQYCAQQNGYTAMANVIKTVVYNEFQHARMFYTALKKGNSEKIDNIDITTGYPFKEGWELQDCLDYAAENESAEQNKIYPEYAKVAEEEGFTKEAALFRLVADVEECHKKLFKDLADQLRSKTLYKKDKAVKWKCSACGHEDTLKEAWKKCPLCELEQGWVMLQLKDN